MKNYEKIVKILGAETAAEMESHSVEELKKSIISAEQAMAQVQKELDENEEYQLLLLSKKDMESGKKEVDKRQRAKIALALHLIESKGGI